MKLLHTSDWHLGMPAGLDTYEENQRFFLDQLYDIIRRERVDAVLCAGDVYDSGMSNAAAIGLYNEAVTNICVRLGTPLILIAGNHDSAPRLSVCRELLRAAGLYVTGRLTRDIRPVLLGDGVAVYPIPFFNRDEVSALFPERREEIRSLESAYQVVCTHIRENMDPGRKNIVLAHAFVVGAELSDSDRSARVGLATAVSGDVFQGFDYVALGHIHKPQSAAPHIRYSGSPLKYSFGAEERQQKGVVLLDTDTMEQTFLPLAPLHDHKSVQGTYEELVARTDLAPHYLNLEVTDRYAGLELLADLQERFPLLLGVRGMELDDGGPAGALSVDELERLDETDIMIKFLAENFQYAPTPEQVSQFREALAAAGEEEEP